MATMTLRIPQAIRRLGRDRRGVSAVEFAMLAPIMVGLYLGCTEISDGVAVDRKVSLTAATLANLAASCNSSNANSGSCPVNTTPPYNISTTEMNNILDASTAIISPYSTSNLKMTLSCINIDSNKVATVKWTATRNGGTGGSVNVPAALREVPRQLLYSEVSYAYTPTIGYSITGTLTLSDRMYMAPRVDAPAYNGIACK
jgi:Flp pilus assembly protein TadG